MKVVVDTSVWSLAFRRQQPNVSTHVAVLTELIKQGRVCLTPSIRQELLSGIRDTNQFQLLRLRMRCFPHESLDIEDHELAAEYFNTCMKAGIQGSSTDFLICAFASRRNYQILTTDQDFKNFQKHIPISLLLPA